MTKFFFAIMFPILLSIAGQTACFASTVVLQWDPNTETDLSGYKVYYQKDSPTQPFQGTGAAQGSAPVYVNKQTTATISGLDPAHAYYFAVTAYNTSGVESIYSNIFSVPELVSPTVSINSPANNAAVSGTLSVTATASDNVGVTRVEFYVNGVLQTTDSTSPYTFNWNTVTLANGSHTLSVIAYDAAENSKSSAISVTVNNPVSDTSLPTASITSPANNSTVSNAVTLKATASDNVGVTRVEFYENGSLMTVSNVAPYNYSWNTTLYSNGAYTLSVKAYDIAGNVGKSGNVSVTVSNGLTSVSSILGDINGDGIVDLADALLALQMAVGNVQPNANQLARGDVAPFVNGKAQSDGVIDTRDALAILSKIVGIITF